MRVKEVMQQELIPMEGERSIQTAEKIIEQSGIDIMPVVMGINITGMITDRDINTYILARGLDPKTPKFPMV